MSKPSNISFVTNLNETRSVFKKCFKNDLFSLVPFDIWKFIVSSADAKSIIAILHTCRAFKMLVEDFGLFNLAKLFRREGHIPMALKYLEKSAEKNDDAIAMFHLGYSYYHSGWGVYPNILSSAEWFKKSGELGYGPGLAYYAYLLLCGNVKEEGDSFGNTWGQKALSTKNLLACGICHHKGLGTPSDIFKAQSYFEASAKEGDEFGQFYYAETFLILSRDNDKLEKAYPWYLKSAEQGHSLAQNMIGKMYCDGQGCEKDKAKAHAWMCKAANQGNWYSQHALKVMTDY